MDIVKIQTLIKQGRVVALSDIDPNESYLQIGVYQPNNRKIGPADANAYAPFVIPLSEVGGNVSWGTITGLLSNQLDLQAALNSKYDASNPAGYITSASLSQVVFTSTIDLNTTSNQPIATLPTGLYTSEKAYVSQASIDLSTSPVKNLIVSNSGIAVPAPWLNSGGSIFTSLEPGPCPPPVGCLDILTTLSLPEMVALLYNDQGCWPPPCNVFVLNGGETLNAQIVTPTGVPATAKIHIILNKIQ